MARLFAFVASAALFLDAASAFMMPALPSQRRMSSIRMAATAAEYKACYEELKEVVDKGNCAPIMVRLAWHDSGTFDASKASMPFPAVSKW